MLPLPLLPSSATLGRAAFVAGPPSGDRGRFVGRRKVTVFCCFAGFDWVAAGSSPALFI